jgi:hypothetical protein
MSALAQDNETRLAEARAVLADIADQDDFVVQLAISVICALSDDEIEVRDARRLSERLEGSPA